MKKLSYSWFPKDWATNEKVFDLTLTERGLYRELIDLAMMNDNKIKLNYKKFERMFGECSANVEQMLQKLQALSLINVAYNIITIPSCDKRLKISNRNRLNGMKGGRPKNQKKTQTKTQTITQTERQRERERESKTTRIKEIKVVAVVEVPQEKISSWIKQLEQPQEMAWREAQYRQWRLKKGKLSEALADFKRHMVLHPPDLKQNSSYSFKDFKTHFNNWMRKKYQNKELIQYQIHHPQKGDL